MDNHPVAPGFPYPGYPLNEVLLRLERLERKIDWIATNADLKVQVPDDAVSLGPQVAPAPPSASQPPVAPAGPAPASGATTPVAATAPPQPSAPGGAYGVQAPQAGAATSQGGPGHVPAAMPGPLYTASGSPQPPVPPTRPATAPAPHTALRRLAEGNLGRYVLSGAAALLVVLAAVSLIALVWDQVPDVLKVLTISLVSLLLVGAGVRLSRARPRQQVAAATLTGTGGALGFVSVIGGVLLNEVVPTYPAFALMTLWSFVLLLVSRYLRQLFTAVVSMIGALVTVGFASTYAYSHPDAALVVWALVTTYLLGLAAVTTALAGSRSNLPWAVWYPTTAWTVTSCAVLLTPLYPLLEEHRSAGLLLLAPPAVLYAQAALEGPRMWRHGHRSLAGVAWAVSTLLTCLLAYRCLDYSGTSSRLATTACLSLLVLHTLAVLVLLLPWTPAGWLHKSCAALLGSTFPLILISAWCESKLIAFYVLALIPAAVACGLQGERRGVLLPLAAAPLVLLLAGDQDYLALSGFLAVALLIGTSLVADSLRLRTAPTGSLPAATAGTEPAVRAVPGPRPPTSRQTGLSLEPYQAAAAAPVAAHGPGRRQMLVATFLLAVDLVLVLPTVLVQLLPLNDDNLLLVELVQASVTLMVLLYLGLTGTGASPWELLRGRYRGQLPGTDTQHRPLAAKVPGACVLAFSLLVTAVLIDLLCASFQPLPGRAPLVLTVIALTVSAIRFLAPWIRQSGPALSSAVLATFVSLCCLNLLTSSSTTGVMTTVGLLVTGSCCILLGFRLGVTAMRHYGLALVLLSVLKLALTDLVTSNSIFRVLALLVAGTICFLLSLAYNKIASDSPPTRQETVAAAPPGAGAAPGGSPGPGGPQVPYGQVPVADQTVGQSRLQAPTGAPSPVHPPAAGHPAPGRRPQQEPRPAQGPRQD